MRTISLRITDETDHLLKRLCRQNGATQTEILRQALENYARTTRQSPTEIARRLDIIGAFSDADTQGAEHALALRERLASQRADQEQP